jgi:paraquat-inducible protein A
VAAVTGRDKLAGGLLFLAAPLLAAGLLMPAVSITHMFVFTDTYSIAGTVVAFWDNGKLLLMAVVLFFSILFPSTKIVIALWAWSVGPRDHERTRRICHLFAVISKWSMLDVFIVALTVLALEGSLFTAADVHVGVVLFAISVIMSTVALQRLGRMPLRRPPQIPASLDKPGD